MCRAFHGVALIWMICLLAQHQFAWAQATNGACGAAQGMVTVAAPTVGLCDAGEAGAVSLNGNTYEWTCAGIDGGSPALCAAPRGYNITDGLIFTDPSAGSFTCLPNPVAANNTAVCTISANPGWYFNNGTSSGGGCFFSEGIWNGNEFTTAPINSNCTLQIQLLLSSYLISTEVHPVDGGTLNCAPSLVQHGNASTCTVASNAGYDIASVTGCGGTLDGNSYTTGSIIEACTVTASFSLTPVDGTCGTAHASHSLLPPSVGLCAAGTAGAVTSADGIHRWSCEGVAGGENAQCAAPGASANDAGGSGNVTFELLGGDGCVVESASLISPPAGLPDGVGLPFGALQFALNGCSPGGSATVQITYDASVDGMVFWKHLPTGWTTMPATLSGNTATFSITDGGPFDADGEVNGRIEDPSGPGGPTGGVAGIPTLSEWMLAALALALLWLGWNAHRLPVVGRRP